ncbi:MAG: hypothetical protein QXT26_08460 [Thermoproteota archaeon]
MRIGRYWYYFRRAWATYIAIPLSVLNSATILYYLLVNNIPFLKNIFPTFTTFIAIILILLPVVVLIGWLDRRLGMLKAETSITATETPQVSEILVRLERIENTLKELKK